MNSQEKFDPFTLEVIQNSLQAASEEMFAVLRKVAMSSVIYENLDFGVAVTDGEGRLASQGSGATGLHRNAGFRSEGIFDEIWT